MNKSDAVGVPIKTVGQLGTIGPYHADINGNSADGSMRGPFEISPAKSKAAPTYPVLWSHDAERECTMMFEGDSEGLTREAETLEERDWVEGKVASIWSTAAHCHFNQNFQFNSQPTAMQFTSRRTIGGRAWISIRLAAVGQEKALVAWANTTFGLLLHWYHANKQQSGRGNIGRKALNDLPVLDVTALSPAQIKAAVAIFDDLKRGNLLPFNELDKDPLRQKLDSRFGLEVLGLPAFVVEPGGPLELTRMKLAREPSISGGKETVGEEEEEEEE